MWSLFAHVVSHPFQWHVRQRFCVLFRPMWLQRKNKRKERGEGVRTGRRGHRKRGLGNRVQQASVRPAALPNAIHPVPREKKDVLIAEVHVERLWVGCDLVAVLPEARVGLDPRLVLGREQDTLAEVDRAVRRGRHQSKDLGVGVGETGVLVLLMLLVLKVYA